jgi:hypothetical protein
MTGKRKTAAWHPERAWAKLSPAAHPVWLPRTVPGSRARTRRTGQASAPMTNTRRLAAYMTGAGRRDAQWSVTATGPHEECTVTEAHGHWYPVTRAQLRRLAAAARRGTG